MDASVLLWVAGPVSPRTRRSTPSIGRWPWPARRVTQGRAPTHLAAAVLEPADGTATRLLQALDVDPAAIRADIAHRLAQAPAAEEAAPSPGMTRRSFPAKTRRLSP